MIAPTVPDADDEEALVPEITELSPSEPVADDVVDERPSSSCPGSHTGSNGRTPQDAGNGTILSSGITP
jgi:hypothetical protein